MKRLLLLFILFTAPMQAQFNTLETENLRLLYYGQTQSYLVSHIGRTFENALKLYREQFGYQPHEKITVLIYDIRDYINGSATAIPRNNIISAIAPQRFVLESLPATERINYIMNHELAHILFSDKAAGSDPLFRTLFLGKVVPGSANPLSMGFAWLTTPRALAPVWYHEGIAVFLETWRTGGSGRLFGGYDEMMFRTAVAEKQPFLDRLELESMATLKDYRGRSLPYLYGTRFFGYLGLIYGPERLMQWVNRTPDSRAAYALQFSKVFQISLDQAWEQWIAWEKAFQQRNLQRLAEQPLTPFQPLTHLGLGSLSRAFFDPATGELYMGVNYPGQVAHLAAMNTATGRLRKIVDVQGAAQLVVTSLAYDPASRTLFFTTDNNDWRDLHSVDIHGKHSITLMQDARIGDLAFNSSDGSLWGVRHDNGYATLVRMPRPYKEWNQVHTWPYGDHGFDLSFSPDGRILAMVLSRINGQQSLILIDPQNWLQDKADYRTISDFDDSTPANFCFSPDGAWLYGSSYYSGVANIYRHNLATGLTEPITNTQTGIFRPIPYTSESLIAFRYTGIGLEPGIVPIRPVPQLNAIQFLGQQIVDQHPVVKSWGSGSPKTIDLEKLTIKKGRYSWLRDFRVGSLYPLVEGYKNATAVGFNVLTADALMLNRLDSTFSFSPSSRLPGKEKFHFRTEFSHWQWKLRASYNAASFYDLFGPTKTSRKGFAFGGEYQKYLIFDEPSRYLDYTVYADQYIGLDRLPDNQNVDAVYSNLLSFGARLDYRFFRRSQGAIDDEKGYQLQFSVGNYLANRKLYPRLYSGFNYGFQLPWAHSSIWLRNTIGKSFGDRSAAFANFYFGGFGNNWVDRLEERRFRDYLRFPGKEIDEVAGNHFERFMVEWTLPALIFRHAGSPQFYLNWVRPSVFATVLSADLARSDRRRNLTNTGIQLDFQTIVISHYHFTISTGVARAFEKGHAPANEWMLSLKIQ